jgi:asparagine synthetase A
LRHNAPERLSFRDIRGRVVMAGGPWRTSGCWWESRAWHYDEWDLEIENASSGLAGFYRVYLDLNASKWFVRGEYD